MKEVKQHRKTNETDIRLTLDLGIKAVPEISTGLPFFDHLLYAMAFHGGFYLSLQATGDIDVDPHHLVEDTGIVLGSALKEMFVQSGGVARYGYSAIPMDDALSEVVIDVCNRSYLVYDLTFPQNRSGDFDMWLLKEFFQGLVNNASINVHCICRYGENSHHMAESLFKALGKALAQSYAPVSKDSSQMSTKGVL